MLRTRKLQAINREGEPLGEMVFVVNFYGHPICPKCGKTMEYWEGQIDQDFMGNNIDGWNHVCHECNIETEVMEGDGGYDRDEW